MFITTSDFENTHHDKPRPSQYAGWLFRICGRSGEFTEFSYTGTYRDACRKVNAKAKLIDYAWSICLDGGSILL